jgi:hypothetical protein
VSLLSRDCDGAKGTSLPRDSTPFTFAPAIVGKYLMGWTLRFLCANSSQNQDRMFQKLKDYATNCGDKQLSSKFKDRYRLRVKEKDREKCLQALKEWNKNLLVVTRQAQKEPPAKKSVSASTMRPSGHLRDLSCVLYRALSNYWNCDCAIRHEARFCLRPKQGLHKCPDPSELDFSLLFSAPTTGAGVTWGWQEGTVLVRSRSCVHQTLN